MGPNPALLPYSIRSFVVRETVGFIPLFPFIFLVMTEIERKYLVWRCRSSWHNKYLKYIDEWINNVLPHQLEYFKKERDNLIKTGTYND